MPFPDLADRLNVVRERINSAVQRGGHGQAVAIVAVTKTHSHDAVVAAWEAGLHDVGENRVQEALPKMDAGTVPVRWHLIGHLQRNKVKSLSRFDLFHALDSLRLADAVDELGRAANHPVEALLQVNVVGEATKGGFAESEWRAAADHVRAQSGVRLRGVMTMAPFDADERTLRSVFSGARRARTTLCDAGHPATELSMGMSNDYELAVEEGATFVRLGTVLFGARPA
ncbi:MAG TPA: YggS family pyridoxal phosphate-dependent enzyme [Gemmatimonadaceae bacterium]|nr:YggS family pyridoxal phosphate-dependent enzyme [Gemmatimonadaceae bacterium]